MYSVSASRVLLIGGSGFLGQHLMRACLVAKMNVRIADVLLPNTETLEHDVEYLQGDYRDPAFLHRIVEGADFVVHLAHDTMILNLNCDMGVEHERNIRPAMQLMDTCCAMGVAKFLFISSGGTVYGNRTLHKPISEDTRTHPISVYGTSKLMIEQIGFLYYIQKSLPFVVARPTNAYGPGQKPFRGQGFVATAFASALKGRTLNIFGDGSIVRDYVHVRDVADALVALLQLGHPGEAYNVGTTHGISLRTLLNECIIPILSADGLELCCEYAPARGVDVAYNVVANDKMHHDTKFTPSIRLEEGLRETWTWIKNNYSQANTEKL